MPQRVALEASTACQLRCPTCPTAAGDVGRGIGTGFLRFDDFRRFIDANRSVCYIELSNYGEIFLNKELPDILRYAYERGVHLYCENGANLNDVPDAVLEAVVRYRLRNLTCSIDGASRETYSIYRRRGDFDVVIANVRKINEWKRRYRSKYPRLRWQFIIFGHNEHEIEQARRLAHELDMVFFPKLAWADMFGEDFSPVRDPERVRRAAGLPAASRKEYREKFGEDYSQKHLCGQLWNQPQINFDGKMLGCCVNYWQGFGNVFEDGLDAVLNGDAMTHARLMLMGKAPPREDVACSSCSLYVKLKAEGRWLDGPPSRRITRPRDGLSLLYGKLVSGSVKRRIRRLGNWLRSHAGDGAP